MRHLQHAFGGVSVETEGAPQVVSACHCTVCQRHAGSAFGLAAFYAKEECPSGSTGLCLCAQGRHRQFRLVPFLPELERTW